jgi:hypothetical protein
MWSSNHDSEVAGPDKGFLLSSPFLGHNLNALGTRLGAIPIVIFVFHHANYSKHGQIYWGGGVKPP